ncbi:Early nodulin-93 [Dendrobium catenatum]|uniref:Early nodulin-93 n=1 Tax=Dendrobium catenatum TaxID=906689 RepID=A0A2I0VHB4_9ASPA|nr:Early nodulin-93 [Dendrobium catenatum]
MAIIAGSVVAVPTLVGCRVIPWAKANLNYTAQALIISAAAISGFFITADKTILKNARGNTIGKREDFGDCKFLDSGFISDEESDDSVFSSASDLMEDDASSSSDRLLDLSLLMANLPIK